MWTFERVERDFDEWVLRAVIFEVNNLVCGRGLDGCKANRVGIDEAIWVKLLRQGGMSDDGIAKVLAGGRMSQRDTAGPFAPFTITTVHALGAGPDALLSPENVDHVVRHVLKFQGRLTDDGTLVKDLPDDDAMRGIH